MTVPPNLADATVTRREGKWDGGMCLLEEEHDETIRSKIPKIYVPI